MLLVIGFTEALTDAMATQSTKTRLKMFQVSCVCFLETIFI